MANEKATIEITADATQFTAATKKMESDLDRVGKAGEEAGNRIGNGLGKGADQAAKEADRAAKAIAREIAAIQRETLRLTEGDAAVRAARLKQLGAPQEQIEPLIASYRKATEQSRQFGMSVRASGYAMSLIPAQMTDIVTQLAGGQSPFLIMVQQGGQLKDMFGGIGPAISAVGSYLSRLVNPLTIAAAALTALGAAYLKGESDSAKFNKALILTGNYAGLTAAQLGDMANKISATTGSYGKASEALIALTNNGRFTASQLENVAEGVVRFSDATGASIEDVAKQFASLADDPLKGILKLDEQYRFLTASTYDQIKALKEQGREQEAATLAQQTFKQATDQMSREVQASLGFVELAWKGIKSVISDVAKAVTDIGRPMSTEAMTQSLRSVETVLAGLEQIEQRDGQLNLENTRKKLAFERQYFDLSFALGKQRTQASEEADRRTKERETIAARESIEATKKQFATRQQLREKELKELEKNAAAAGNLSREEIDALRKQIEEKYKDPTGRAVTDDAATRMLQNLREQEAAIIAQLGASEQLTSAEREHAKFTQLIADLKEKSILTADQQSLLARKDEILEQLKLNAAAEDQLRIKKEMIEVETRGKQIAESIVQAELSRGQQYDNQLMAVGQGREAFNRIREEAQLRESFQKFQNQLSKNLSEGTIGTDKFKAEQERINQGLQESIENFRRYYEQLDSLQANWAVGASAGFADYAASARNAAQASSNLIGNAFKGMEDALVTFVRTGKLSFSSLVDSILSDLVRMSLRQAVLGPLAGALGTIAGNLFTPSVGGSITNPLAGDVSKFFNGSSGGYTGNGGKYEPAGIVHRGEYVLTKEATQGIGVGALDRLNKSYANGGLVGGSVAGGMNSGAVNINIKNEAGGDGYQATATATKNESGINIDVLVRRSMANDIRNNGPISQQLGGAFGLRRTA